MKISIVTVAYNSAATIADTLRTVAMQTHQNFEHLVIDGKSKDSTLAVVAAHRYPGLTLVSEPDSGIYDAMNKGLRLATGEVIGFLNSDDFYADAAVLEKVAAAFQDASVEACFADLVYVTPDNSRVARFWKSKPFTKGDFSKGWCPAHPTFYIRKSALRRLGGFDESFKLAADVEFMMRYLERGAVQSVYIPHVLVRMRLGGTSNQSWGNVWQQNKAIFEALRKNKVPFNVFSFWANKLVSRAWQVVAARLVKPGPLA
ncbi:MAG: glycosyltransferase family 2 protein [Rhodoferax sp.]|uniref:glycosyltransferase family 2 protein n=1 Tax=Rhodoferax sp. TaxID=50421 RepID=UPI002ACDD596|nr:glycosyltransferase family 2 protein [Rhodoferax sp.]MDZ7891014.1 glycosyltransferase family 2 protein [Rhodoferax sp.]